MHEVLADVVDELLGSSAAAATGAEGLGTASEAAAAADAWMLVSELGTQPYRDNALGVCRHDSRVHETLCSYLRPMQHS
jgi:hypothetical protein